MLKPQKCREKNHKIKYWAEYLWDLKVKLHKINTFLATLLIRSCPWEDNTAECHLMRLMFRKAAVHVKWPVILHKVGRKTVLETGMIPEKAQRRQRRRWKGFISQFSKFPYSWAPANSFYFGRNFDLWVKFQSRGGTVVIDCINGIHETP